MRHPRLGLRARIDAIIHKILHPKHDVQWRINVGNLCKGDITCETCGHIFWCRWIEGDHD